AKKIRCQQNYPLRVLLGGSAGVYAEAREDTFLKKKERLASSYRVEGKTVKVLAEGAVAKAWSIPYDSNLDQFGVAVAMRTLLAIEREYKQEADVLLLPIMAEAASKAAATEIGFLLLNALISGQDVHIFLEAFDPVDFMRHQLSTVKIKADAEEEQRRAALREAGVSEATLAAATQTEIFETFALLEALVQGDTITFKQIKQSLLGQTEAFQTADNIHRVRVLVQAHLEKLSADARYPNFFAYATQI
ncbi:MAG TPA: hypothetical protein VEC96_13960, partial [Anaerolineae bacterium]|nr:hypothetical protein [Anaerolineae bacterium]